MDMLKYEKVFASLGETELADSPGLGLKSPSEYPRVPENVQKPLQIESVHNEENAQQPFLAPIPYAACTCREYGQHSIRATEKVKKVTVFLNPAAKNGKAVKQFEKNAAPILHLAGLSVEILKSTHEGHVKDQVAALGATDSILVVGGDGTLAEVITGLLRRSDAESCSNWPIGVIPVGVTNTLARLLYTDSTNEVRAAIPRNTPRSRSKLYHACDLEQLTVFKLTVHNHPN
ncbi:putative acylglycerol kinase, mitochondrial [Apostichopus japonicus]|uniref:Putative acylglycerol kinase, mitochondrial n=1 Tax=Stichopus japonicus TaxID=307972 RepID=A0A2G8KI12_STIJA|nr:putative acylglycerol kinase, mitochondrial [Apostichopus japonicus]